MKKVKIIILSCLIMLCTAAGVHAANIDMYINENYVVRDLETVGEFDMLPILDIANELGYQCSFDGEKAMLYNNNNFYIFVVGNALVTDKNGNLYGLDIVPQFINGNLYVPAKFFQDLGMTYTWDDVTSTLFINSDYTYQWLISTPEHQKANPKYMARVYSTMLRNTGRLITYGGDMVDYRRVSNNITDLYYYMDDVNYDNVLDLVVGDCEYESNGVIVYSYDGSSVYPIYQPGMPYSSGVEIFTLATYNGRYGFLRHRQNSADEFDYRKLLPGGKIEILFSGYHYFSTDDKEHYFIDNAEVGRTKWYDIFNSIQPVQFYSIWDLENMAY